MTKQTVGVSRAVRRAGAAGAACAAAMLATLAAPPAAAFQFGLGPAQAALDSTASYGGLWRMQGRSSTLVGIANGGSSRSVNGDDGDLNYNTGDMVSSLFKLTSDFEVKYGRFGLFTRGTAFYDEAVAGSRDKLGPNGDHRLMANAQVLDLFVHGRFEVFGRNLSVRVGKQVLNWGESTFIPNGIGVINPVDVAKLRSPGAELKEAFIPIPIVSLSQELTDNLSIEAMAIMRFDQIKIDPRGAFFSTNDVISDDSSQVFLTFGRRKDQHYPPTNPSPNPALAAFGPFDGAASLWVQRGADVTPDGFGQFGVNLHYLADWLNGGTEFGLYYLHYHSRIPLISATKTDTVGIGSTSDYEAAGYCSIFTGTPAEPLTGNDCSIRYYAEYPKDINLIGVSFNTQGPAGIALQGEYSYRPNLPVQLPVQEEVLAALNLPSQYAANPFDIPLGATLKGYERVGAHQLQVTATKAFAQVLGADQLITLAEAGYDYLDLPSNLKFNGPGAGLPVLPVYAGAPRTESGGSVQTDGFATRSSYGIRTLVRGDYLNVFGRFNVSPRVAYSYDIKGEGPNFNQGVQATALGLNVSYQEKYQADIGYTWFFGGRRYCGTDQAALSGAALAAGQPLDYCTDSNELRDRDFLAATVSYSF